MNDHTQDFDFAQGSMDPMLTIHQLSGEVVIQHPDVDLLFTIAQRAKEIEGDHTGGLVTELPAPLHSLIAAAFDDPEMARELVLTAASIAMSADVDVALHNGAEWEPGEVRDELKKRTSPRLN